MLFEFFVILQSILFMIMLLHDVVSIKPLNDIEAINKVDTPLGIMVSTIINTVCVAIPLYLTVSSYAFLPQLKHIFTIVCFYGGLTLGTIGSWWLPYIFGSNAAHKAHFAKFNNTHHFLPARGDNVIPNTLHVILHLFVWACFALALYFYVR